MIRSRREIKTPKRFDDEPFESHRKSHGSATKLPPPLAPIEPPPVKSTPEPTSSKNVIKIKLTKTKPRDSPSTPVHNTIEPETAKSENSITPTSSPSAEKVKVERKFKREKEKEIEKEREPDQTNIIKLPIPHPQKKRRPRTPPVFTDIIPNVVLPFWDARTAAEEHEDDNVKELVHCQCGIVEELGLMVQCETCLTWQHAQCLGIDKPEDAPDGYTCQACSDPRFARESMRWAYDQDWLLKGRMKQFSCDSNPLDEKNVAIINQINRLIDDSLRLVKLIHSFKVKTRLLDSANDEDPELKLFKNQWAVNYQHSDGTQFVPTFNQTLGTPTSTMSAMAEAPDPCDIPVETVAEATLPEIGQLVDVSSILDNTDIPTNESVSDDCRSNLRLNIQQTEEFISMEMKIIERKLESLEKQCNDNNNRIRISFDSLRSDLCVIRNHIARVNKK